MPYQTLIASVLHKYVSGRLVSFNAKARNHGISMTVVWNSVRPLLEAGACFYP